MNKLLLLLQSKQLQVASVSMLLASIAFVVYLYPREAKFKYEFQKGKPWLYEDLVARFDFPILKTETELRAEREAVQKNRTLFFERDANVSENGLLELEKEVDLFWTRQTDSLVDAKSAALKRQLKTAAKSIVAELYAQGILKPFQIEKGDAYGEVLLDTDGFSKTISLGNLLTMTEAGMLLKKKVESHPLSDELKRLQPLMINSLEYNILYDEVTTIKYLEEQLSNVLPTKNVVQVGELIIIKGSLVDSDKYAKLNSLRQAYAGNIKNKNRVWYILTGQILIVSILYMALLFFLLQYRKKIMEDISKFTFILLNIALIVLMGKFTLSFGVEYMYLAPFPILPIILRSFFDTRLALFVHMVAILLVGFFVPNSLEFIYLQFVAGIFAIILVNNLYKRSQLFFTAAKIIGIYCVSYLSLALIQEGTYEQIEWQNLGYFVGNGFLTLVSFPLIYFQEKIFGFVSDVSLLELSDTNNPLLREMAQKAPGTFQHSMQVANLAEAAVLKIEGNALLVRTGALYHDIGKMAHPMYFIENQHTGLNPHDELSFEESAQMIIGHVKEGIKMAKKHNLPDLLVDFIRTHHGTSTVMYFYKQFIKNFPEEEVDLEKFTYPGPKPFSKETAALMMADSVEAASRSLKKPNAESIDKLVEGIIDHQMKSGQFENADITLKEIKDIKKIFKKMLMNIYHVRIQYPD
jgi:putative nucleotidyltransferase with HDIG domain